jgi:hypothetical protein
LQIATGVLLLLEYEAASETIVKCRIGLYRRPLQATRQLSSPHLA